jgi:hypothetical protein
MIWMRVIWLILTGTSATGEVLNPYCTHCQISQQKEKYWRHQPISGLIGQRYDFQTAVNIKFKWDAPKMIDKH